MREKVAKSRNTVFFQCFVAPDGRKVGSLKRRVGSYLVRWDWKPARRYGAKHMWKWTCAPHVRTTFGTWDVEKAHAVVASQSNCEKHWKAHHVRTTFRSWDVEKWRCRAKMCKAHLEVKMQKTHHVRITFSMLSCWTIERRIDRKIDRQTDRQTDKQIDR